MIKVIAGRFNGVITSNYWLENEVDAEVGDYVIVENRNGYDLVEVTGILETDEKHISLIHGNKINKKALGIVSKEDLGIVSNVQEL